MRSTFVMGALVVIFCGTAVGGTYTYGDFTGQDVDFIGVSESSSTDSQALFGDPSCSGNTLCFLPGDFTSSASNGSSDETIGVLTMTINAKGDQEIRGVRILEYGTANISGTTTAATYAGFDNDLQVVVNGSSYGDSAAQTFYSSVSMWDGSTIIDLYGMDVRGVTSVSVTFTSGLETASEDGTTAHIQGSLLEEEIQVGVIIPEPATMGLLTVGGVLALARRRSRR
jgi:hypothetical protein